MQDPELTIDRAMMEYKALGYSDNWINQRLKSIEIRKELTDEWKRHGLQEGVQFATLTDIIYQTWAGKTSKEYKKFYYWVKTSDKLYGGSPIPKERLLRLQDYDFTMSHEKNYIEHPKSNGYESWQASFTVEASSPKAGGSMFELQGRTSQMEELLEYGLNSENQKDLSHEEYKQEMYSLRNELFSIKEYKGGLLYFNPAIGYDADGIGKSKQIASRTSSVHLVSEKSANAET